jgi:hypothetical protein
MATKEELLSEADRCWKAGDYLNAGRALFERVPAPDRGKWACRVLASAAPAGTFNVPPVRELLGVCAQPDAWRGAKAIFSRIRHVTLKLEGRVFRRRNHDARLNYVYLAENVAKVLYNATDPPDEFDEDAGWWVAICLRGFLEHDAAPDWERKAWSILALEE